MEPAPYFVEFHFRDERQLEGIRRVAAALKEDKEAGALRGIREYAALFGPAALDRLWWPEGVPRQEVLAAWERHEHTAPLREEAPAAERRWSLDGLLDLLDAGDFQLLGCRAVGEGLARLEFTTGGWPYGGTSPLWGLVEAFGARVVAEDDGFGPRAV